MARPKTYEMPRVHLGIRFDKYFVTLFDKVAKKHGLSRPQAVEFCLREAVRTSVIPQWSSAVDAMIEEERRLQSSKPSIMVESPFQGDLSAPAKKQVSLQKKA